MEDNRNERGENEKIADDKIKLYEIIINSAKREKERLKRYGEELGALMDCLETDYVKQELAEFTQENYKDMLDVEVDLALAEKALNALKFFRSEIM